MQAKSKEPMIRVENGKCYLTRNGAKAGPMEHNPRVFYYHHRGLVEGETKTRAWDGFGRCSAYHETPWDIVAEYAEPAVDPVAEAAKILATVAAYVAKPLYHVTISDGMGATPLSAVAAASTPLDKVPETATSERATICRYIETLKEAGAAFDTANADQPADEYKPSAGHAWADFAEPGYSALAGILQEAHNHAAIGKGKERHAKGNAFRDQPIMAIPRSQGTPAGQIYQVQKKSGEALGMYGRGRDEAAIAELLGVINYAAAAILHIREAH